MVHKQRAQLILADMVKIMKDLRLKKGLSHETLAQMAGITRPAISHIESGKRKPSLMMCLRLAHALDTELSEIIRQSEETTGQ